MTAQALAVPTTYAEWSHCIDVFEAGGQDDEVILAMSQGTLNWSSGVADLFAERISAAFSTRLRRCAERMERDFRSGSDEATVVRAMLDTRRTLARLHRVANLPVFPDRLGRHLADELGKYAGRAQRSLEDSARHDRSGRLASTLRHNSLLKYEQFAGADVVAAPAAATGSSATPISPADGASRLGRRRIILATALALAGVLGVAGGGASVGNTGHDPAGAAGKVM